MYSLSHSNEIFFIICGSDLFKNDCGEDKFHVITIIFNFNIWNFKQANFNTFRQNLNATNFNDIFEANTDNLDKISLCRHRLGYSDCTLIKDGVR